METYITVIDKEDECFIYGHNDHYNNNVLERTTHWFKIKNEYHKILFWMIYPPDEIFNDKNMNIDKENCYYLQNIFEDDWVRGVYFIEACCYEIKEFSNDISKLIINELSAFAKEFNVSIFNTFEPHYINETCKAIFRDKKFEKKYFMEILNRLVCGEPIDIIAKDDRFVKVDSSFLDGIIDKIVSENASKNDGSDKILNWFIGQVMKETKGKVSASVVKDKLKEKLSK